MLRDIKSLFPIFKNYPDLTFLDNAATTQKPQIVIDAVNEFYTKWNSNVHRGVYRLAEKADQLYENSRTNIAKYLSVNSNNIVFTKGATEAANFLAFTLGEEFIKEGDEIIVSQLEHHSNYLPWQEMAIRKNAIIKEWPLKDDLELDYKWLEENLTPKTKVIAVTAMSNVVGVGADFHKISNLIGKHNILVVGDFAQAIVHQKVNFADLPVDAVFFSGHKVYGPMGSGCLYLSDDLANKLPPYMTGGGMILDLPDRWMNVPQKFEAGTPNVVAAVGLERALAFVNELTMDAIISHEKMLFDEYSLMLKNIKEVEVFAAANGIISFLVNGVHVHDLSSVLAENNVCIRAGHHCAKPLMKKLGNPALARVSLAVYNDVAEIAVLEEAIYKAIKLFK